MMHIKYFLKGMLQILLMLCTLAIPVGTLYFFIKGPEHLVMPFKISIGILAFSVLAYTIGKES